jgi:plasmid stabilization system protein ParE
MEVIYTEQALQSLEEVLDFLMEQEVPTDQVTATRDRILDKADSLTESPWREQQEEYLMHLEKEHRRIVEGHYKIIYRVEGQAIYITDIFDSRQNPSRMKD